MEDVKCFIGMHKYKLHKEEDILDFKGNKTGKKIVSICQHCGKVKTWRVDLTDRN